MANPTPPLMGILKLYSYMLNIPFMMYHTHATGVCVYGYVVVINPDCVVVGASGMAAVVINETVALVNPLLPTPERAGDIYK